LPPNLRIRGHLPAPIINGGGDSLQKWPNFRPSRACDLDLDLGSGHTHTVMHHSLTSTYTPNFIEIEETFCGRTDGHLRCTLLGRLDLEESTQKVKIFTGTSYIHCYSLLLLKLSH